MDKLNARDILAFLIICGLIAFKLTGHNGTFDAVAALIVGYYFGRRGEVSIQAPSDLVPPA